MGQGGESMEVGGLWGGIVSLSGGPPRSRAELETRLGKRFAGVLSSDDVRVDNGYAVKAQQKWLAHLRRHFKHVINLKQGNKPPLGQVFIDWIDPAFAAHRQWRATQDASAYQRWAAGFQREVQTALERRRPKAGDAAGWWLRAGRDKAAHWGYVLDPPEVPPDHHRAERSFRLAVTKRKVCGASRSMAGFAQTAI